jgi:hypothetical protein
MLWPFGIFFTVLVFWTKKNLATLLQTDLQVIIGAMINQQSG